MFTLMICMYLYTIDELLKTYVIHCSNGNVKRLVDVLQYDNSYRTTVSVILESLLLEKEIIAEASKCHRNETTPVLRSSDREELDHSNKLIDQLAKAFLSAPTYNNYRPGEASFEEDVLRIIFLESIGGISDTTSIHDVVSRRHHREISHWIDTRTDRDENMKQKEIAIVLVRGFSIFIGGFGEALTLCTSPANVVNGAIYTWIVSPSALLCVQFAIRGVTRCILRSFQPSGRILLDWMTSNLATMVPTALTSLFYLRVGVLNYAKYQSKSQNNNRLQKVDEIELVRIVQIADAAAISILRAVSTHSNNVKLELREDALQWTRFLLSKEKNEVETKRLTN